MSQNDSKTKLPEGWQKRAHISEYYAPAVNTIVACPNDRWVSIGTTNDVGHIRRWVHIPRAVIEALFAERDKDLSERARVQAESVAEAAPRPSPADCGTYGLP